MFGKYAAFIVPAYLVTGLALAGVAVWIMGIYRHRLGELKRLEEAGLKRRSQEKAG